MTTKTPIRPHSDQAVPAFKLFRVRVARIGRLSPHLVRVTFEGPELNQMTSGGLDQRVKLLFPLPGQDEPHLPEERSYQALRAMPLEHRPQLRTYTIRAHRPECGEFDVDFVVHGDTGPGSRFARGARPGDAVAVYAPNAEFTHGERFAGVEYKLDKVTRLRTHALLIGDESALPAIGSILETLPAKVAATVCVELPDAADVQSLTTVADAEVRWLVRSWAGEPGAAIIDALRSMPVRGVETYAWVAGESSMVKAVRRHLVRDQELPRHAVTFMGYWRDGEPAEPRRSTNGITR